MKRGNIKWPLLHFFDENKASGTYHNTSLSALQLFDNTAIMFFSKAQIVTLLTFASTGLAAAVPTQVTEKSELTARAPNWVRLSPKQSLSLKPVPLI